MNILKKDLKYDPRPEQKQAIDFIKNTFDKNDISKFFILDLPVGIGKSYLCMMIIDYYLKNVNKSAKFDVLTNSRILQEQYTEDFNTPSNLWGKNNYQCDQYSCSCKEGKELAKMNKTKCEECPYDNARDGYYKSKVNLTNFHLYILLSMFQPDVMDMREKNVLIIDEAHDFESIFSEFISFTLSESYLKKLGFTKWKELSKSIRNVNNLGDFLPLSDNFLNEVKSTKAKITRDVNNSKNKDSSSLKKINDLEELEKKITNFISDYEKVPENWVLEWEIDKDKKKKISIKPVWAHPYLEEYIWSKYDHVFFMSGTILDKNLFTYLNGVPNKLSVYHSIPSPFPVKNRPIYYFPIAKMTYNNKKNAFNEFKPVLNTLLRKYSDKKGIFHTHTYEIADWVRESVKSNRFIFHSSDDKDKALRKHSELMDEPTVLVSPSMATGVNLEYDKARFQIMLKVPYPSLGSTKNKMRQKTMPDWYAYATVSKIIQSYGRAIRSYDDTAEFIIIDGSFSDVMRYSSKWIPNWMASAIRQIDPNKLKSKS